MTADEVLFKAIVGAALNLAVIRTSADNRCHDYLGETSQRENCMMYSVSLLLWVTSLSCSMGETNFSGACVENTR